jgi:ADP-ribosylglycohydrolase
MSIDNYTFDVGIQTYTYLNTYKKKRKFEIEESPNEYQNGNGSLMRCLPLAFMAYWIKSRTYSSSTQTISC